MIDIQVAYDKLASMETADEIAEFFQGQGVKAVPNNGRLCAISKWISDITGIKVSTNAYDIVTMQGETFSHTEAIGEFICNFDEMGYPDILI